MRVSTTRGYKGRGRFTLRPLAGGRPFELGNVVSLNESIETERDGRQNFMEAAGGELDVLENITSFTFELEANDISPRNIALGKLGSVEEVAAGAVTDEAANAWPRMRVAFRYLPDPDESVSVAIDATASHQTETAYAVGATILDTGRAYLAVTAGTTDAVAPTFPTDYGTVSDGTVTWKDLGETALVADTDYARTPHGIQMLAAADDRFHEDLAIPLTVDYARNPQYLIQSLVNSGEEFEIIWHGLNAVDNANPITKRYFRVKFSPTSGFTPHGGDDFASLTLSGTVLADETRVGAGLSQYEETAMI